MKVQCTICRSDITASEPGAVLQGMSEHLVTRHQNQAAELNQLICLFSTFALLKRFAKVSVSETEIREVYDAAEQILLSLFGPPADDANDRSKAS